MFANHFAGRRNTCCVNNKSSLFIRLLHMENSKYKVRTEAHWQHGQQLTERQILDDLAIQTVALGLSGMPVLQSVGQRLKAIHSMAESVVLGSEIGSLGLPTSVEWLVDKLPVPLQMCKLQERQTELLHLRKQMRGKGNGNLELLKQLDWVIHRNRRQLELLNRDPEIQGSRSGSKHDEKNGRDHIW